MTEGFSLPVLVDALIAVLLVATIAYAVVINGKLSVLRNAKVEMEALVARFAESTAQAENGILTLKAHATESGSALDNTTNRAHGLADDLAFLIERGADLANRLEGAIGSARGKGASGAQSGFARADWLQGEGPKLGAAKTPPAAEISPEEAALLGALRGVR